MIEENHLLFQCADIVKRDHGVLVHIQTGLLALFDSRVIQVVEFTLTSGVGTTSVQVVAQNQFDSFNIVASIKAVGIVLYLIVVA